MTDGPLTEVVEEEPEDRSEEVPELARLRRDAAAGGTRIGPSAGPTTGFVVTWRGHHDRPQVALTQLRELLLSSVPLMGEHDDDAALAALPAWFVQQCRPEYTREESAAESARLRSRTDAQRAEHSRTARWSAQGWLFWLEPDERSWWWWDGRADGSTHLVVDVLTHGHPYGSGSLQWMLRAVGCTDLTEDGRPVDLRGDPGHSAREDQRSAEIHDSRPLRALRSRSAPWWRLRGLEGGCDMRSAYKGIAFLIALGVLIQAAAVAGGWFGTINEVDDGAVINSDYEGNIGHAVHGINGMMIMPLLGLLLLIVSAFAKIPGGAKWAGLTLLAIVVQVVLAFVAFGAPVVGVLHGANAFVVLGLALYAGRRVASGTTTTAAQTGTPATV
jgi:hypothetical protein